MLCVGKKTCDSNEHSINWLFDIGYLCFRCSVMKMTIAFQERKLMPRFGWRRWEEVFACFVASGHEWICTFGLTIATVALSSLLSEAGSSSKLQTGRKLLLFFFFHEER